MKDSNEDMRWAREADSGVYACLDLGSNSFHLLVVRFHKGRVELLERCSEKVQLGQGLGRGGGSIQPDAFTRGIDCLKRFRKLMKRYSITACSSVGTNALRVAANASTFIEEAGKLGIDIRVISGEEEAALIYSGVVEHLRQRHGDAGIQAPDAEHRLVIDIGGGSTEIVMGGRGKEPLCQSVPIGSVSWRDSYFPWPPDSPVSPADTDASLDLALCEARSVFAGLRPPLGGADWDEAWAASGTAKMLAAVCAARGGEAGVISLSALLSLRPTLLAWREKPGENLPGLKEKRRELLLPGWSIMVALLQGAKLERLRVSPAALREGLIYRMLRGSGSVALRE